MAWQRRLMELVCAGGALATMPGCPPIGGPGCGNANPDPCICGRTKDPDHSQQCIAEKECEDNGGSWEFFGSGGPPSTDGGADLWGYCGGYPKDAGPDAPRDAPPDAPPDAHQ